MRKKRKKIDLSLLILSFTLSMAIVVGVTGAWLSAQIEGDAGSESFGVVSINNVGTDAEVFQTVETNLDTYLMPGDEMTIEFDIENNSNVKILLRSKFDMHSENYGQGNQYFDDAFNAINDAFRTELADVLSDWQFRIEDGFFYLMPNTGGLIEDVTSGDYYALDGGFTSLSSTFLIPTGTDYPEIDFNVLQGETVTFSFVVEAVQAANQFVGVNNDEPWLAGGWSIAAGVETTHTFGVFGVDLNADYIPPTSTSSYSHPQNTDGFVLGIDIITKDIIELDFEITNDYTEDFYVFITPSFDIVDGDGVIQSIDYNNTNASNLTELSNGLREAMVASLKSGWTYASQTILDDVDFLGATYYDSHEGGFFLDASEISDAGHPLLVDAAEVFETTFDFSADLYDDLKYIYLDEEFYLSLSFGVSALDLSSADYANFIEDTTSSVSANAQLAMYAFTTVIQAE